MKRQRSGNVIREQARRREGVLQARITPPGHLLHASRGFGEVDPQTPGDHRSQRRPDGPPHATHCVYARSSSGKVAHSHAQYHFETWVLVLPLPSMREPGLRKHRDCIACACCLGAASHRQLTALWCRQSPTACRMRTEQIDINRYFYYRREVAFVSNCIAFRCIEVSRWDECFRQAANLPCFSVSRIIASGVPSLNQASGF